MQYFIIKDGKDCLAARQDLIDYSLPHADEYEKNKSEAFLQSLESVVKAGSFRCVAEYITSWYAIRP